MGRGHGITEEQLRELPRYAQSPAFSSQERLVLDYAVELTRTPVEVPDELFKQLREHFDESELLELTAVIAWENYRARFNHALGIESGGFSEGAYCPLPERPVKPAG